MKPVLIVKILCAESRRRKGAIKKTRNLRRHRITTLIIGELLLNGAIKTIVLDPKFSKQIDETPLAFIRTLALPNVYQHGCLGKIQKVGTESYCRTIQPAIWQLCGNFDCPRAPSPRIGKSFFSISSPPRPLMPNSPEMRELEGALYEYCRYLACERCGLAVSIR
jgi:hypothetical protein